MQAARVVRHIPINQLLERLDKPVYHRKPLGDVFVGEKIRYRCKVWVLVQKQALGRGWYSITLKRGMGESEEETSCKGKRSMTLEVLG